MVVEQKAKPKSQAQRKPRQTKPKPAPKPAPAILMATAAFGALLGITKQRVDQLAAEGTFQKAARGKYDIHVNIPRYLDRLREAAAGRQGESESGEKIDPIFERAMKDRVDRQIKELKLAQARGEVVQMSDVMVAWGRVVTAAKAKMMSLSSRLPTMIHGLNGTDIAVIQDEVRGVLEQLVDDGNKVPDRIKKAALADDE